MMQLKKLGAALMALALTLTLLPAAALGVEGDAADYSYVDKEGITQTVAIASDHVISDGWTEDELDSGFYIVTGTLTLSGTLEMSGTSLILADGASLTVNGNVLAYGSSTTAIYGQEAGSGCLTVTASTGSALSHNNIYGLLGIYGGIITASAAGNSNRAIYSAGELEIVNSTVIAASEAEAIYGSESVLIKSSTVSADGGYGYEFGAGIRSTSHIEILKSQVTATGASYGLDLIMDGAIVIDGGSVSATAYRQPTNGTAPVYKTTLYFESADAGDAVSRTGGVPSYDLGKAKLDSGKKLYLWLPAGPATFNLTVGETPVEVPVTVKTDNTSYWPLEKHTVTFDPKGGTLTGESTAETSAGSGRLSALPEATRDGYVLGGWYSAFYSDEEITTSTAFSSDTTVYARWLSDPGSVSPMP